MTWMKDLFDGFAGRHHHSRKGLHIYAPLRTSSSYQNLSNHTVSLEMET
jgi:hypothetical protein